MTRPAHALQLAFALLALAAAAAPAAAQSKKVHAVVILDTNSNLKEELEENAKLLQKFLEGGIPDDALSVTYLRANEVTLDTIEAKVRNLPVGRDDTLFCFVGCHGATVRGRHAFQFSGSTQKENVARDDIRQILLEKNSRLTVLLSDSCSNPLNDLPLKERDDDVRAFGARPRAVAAPAFQKLLLDTRGVVDINSSYEGDLSWTVGKRGGVFTQALHDTFAQLKDRPSIAWPEFYEHLKRNTQKTFRNWKGEYITEHEPRYASMAADEKQTYDEFKSQQQQTTQAFFLTDTRIKILTATEIGRGARVTEVLTDSPARKATPQQGLMPKDVIVAVNDIAVDSVRALGGVLDPILRDPGEVRLKLRVLRNGEELDREIVLPRQ